MTPADLLRLRLVNQQLVGTRFRQPAEIVAWLGAMQAQEYAMAKWAIGLRLPGVTDAAVEKACDAGAILRTHVLRPTWHFVAPADIRWLVALAAPRVRAAMAYMNRQLELDAALFKRSRAVLTKTLQGGQQLTRTDLQAALRRARIVADGPRLGHLMMDAELDGLICSGARHGKQSTYALLEERVPPAKPLDRAEALAELSHRYFSSRGPATVQDFAEWSGLTVTDAKAGAATLGRRFSREIIDGRTYIFPTAAATERAPSPRPANFLLPDYDEYGMGYVDRRALFATPNRSGKHAAQDVAYNRMIVLDGLIQGSWGRTESARGIAIEVVPFAPLNARHRRALAQAAARFSSFVGKPVQLVFCRPR